MEDEIIFTPVNQLESLVSCREYVTKNKSLLAKLDTVIDLELDLALLNIKKAIAKLTDVKDNVRKIK